MCELLSADEKRMPVRIMRADTLPGMSQLPEKRAAKSAERDIIDGAAATTQHRLAILLSLIDRDSFHCSAKGDQALSIGNGCDAKNVLDLVPWHLIEYQKRQAPDGRCERKEK